MATTIAHGTIPTTACIACTIAPLGVTPQTVIIAFVTSILTAYWSMKPDTIGIKGGSFRGNWEAYNSAHSGEIAIAMIQLPWWRVNKYFFEFHLWYDRFFHKEEGGWTVKGIVLEVIQDAILLTLLVLMVGVAFTVFIVLALALYFGATIAGAK